MTWLLPAALDQEHTNDAVGLLRRYFEVDTEGHPKFTGAMFERFGGGGDALECADRFTAADIVAVSMLSVDVPAPATLRILDSERHRLNEVLATLPVDLDLVSAADGPLQAGDRLWALVREAGVGPVTTSKLLARKRPRLLPVIDTIVKAELGHPRRGDFYRTLQQHLAADQRSLHHHLEHLRELAGIGDDISAIRCFDIIVWLTGRFPSPGSARPGN